MKQSESGEAMPKWVRSMVHGDFTEIAHRFAIAGFDVQLPAAGVLQLAYVTHVVRPRLLLSVGVHGDETAPIEMVAQLLHALSTTPAALAVDLMIVVGNLAAIAEGKRFVDADLNRLFRVDRGELQSSSEAARADDIMHATAAFFADSDADKWHLDLHAAIRPSHYPTFAVVPAEIADIRKNRLLAWLGRAGIGAAILNNKPAGTFSAWTVARFGAASATVELGQVSALGSNDPERFCDTRDALDSFIRTARIPAEGNRPDMFRVTQELVKHSEAFHMAMDANTWNFTGVEPGSVIATDGGVTYRAGGVTEYIVFPNPDVRPGLRTGLMVVRA